MRQKKQGLDLTPLQVELREAMGVWGCPLCRLSSKAEHSFIESLNYERVLDLKTRDALKASRGLCDRHSQMWRSVQGSALGIAIVYRISVLDLLRDTEPSEVRSQGLLRRRGRASATAQALKATATCPACAIGEETVRRYGALLLSVIEDDDFQALLRDCGGLCLPHLRDVLGMAGADRVHDLLIGCHRQAWARLMGELEEFIRKNDYRFGDEKVTLEEGTSWTRALDILTGYRDDSDAT